MGIVATSSFDFSGTIDHVQLVDVIQLACPCRKSLTFRVKSNQGLGNIHIRDGQVVHVETNELAGEDALFEMLVWNGGCFESKPLEVRDVTSVSKPWEYLLIDATRFCDERTSGGLEEKAPEEPDSTSLFRGSVESVQLLDIVQLICIMRTSHVVKVQSQNRSGRIWLSSGQVQHAQTGLQGEEALFDMLMWQGGSFKAVFTNEQFERTIKKPWELLIIKAVRLRDEATEKTDEQADDRVDSLAQKVLRMKTGAKIRLALTGDREARSLLIRDGNRVVQLALIGNHKITESEVNSICCSRNVDEEVLRKIAANREWMRSYQIRNALVNNPKNPLPISLKLVPTLLPQDLRRIAKSKAIPNVVSMAARRLVLQGEV